MWSKELAILLVHTSVLVARTFISIYVAKLEGTMVKFIVQKDIRSDLRRNLRTSWRKKKTFERQEIRLHDGEVVRRGRPRHLHQLPHQIPRGTTRNSLQVNNKWFLMI